MLGRASEDGAGDVGCGDGARGEQVFCEGGREGARAGADVEEGEGGGLV